MIYLMGHKGVSYGIGPRYGIDVVSHWAEETGSRCIRNKHNPFFDGPGALAQT